MSIQWTIIAGYLYFEIAVVTLLMLPVFSARRWNRFFRSQMFSMFLERAATYFKILLGVLGLFLADAIRDMKKYSHGSEATHIHLSTEMKESVKLFRAQRNFYITGFTIFLAFVIRKLVSLIIIQYELQMEVENKIGSAKTSRNSAIDNTKGYEELSAKLEEMEQSLRNEKRKIEELKEEADSWKVKYEEANARAAIGGGRGDEK